MDAVMPLLDPNEKDDRFDEVMLLEQETDYKQTAEDCGDYWYIRDWEIMELGGKNYLYSSSGYTISKQLIKTLSAHP